MYNQNQNKSFLNPLYNLQQFNNLSNFINLPQNINFFQTHSFNYILTNQSNQFLTKHYLLINSTLQIQPTPSNPSTTTYIQPQPLPPQPQPLPPQPQQIHSSYNLLPTQPNLTPTPSIPNPIESL